MLRIAIITAYYGKFPSYYRAWLRSAQCNADIDFYIVTDLRVDRIPRNVKQIPLSFDEFHALIETKLGGSVNLDSYYKINDYKPMFGVIFEDLLKNYDWWAYADMDVIFGDIRKFIDLYNIEEYEHFIHSSCLSFYKNNQLNNQAFMLDGAMQGNWLDVITTDKVCGFDERGGIYSIYKKNKIPMLEKTKCANISSNFKRFRLSDGMNYDQQVFYWQDGGIFRTYIDNGQIKEEEFLCLHLKKRHFTREAFDVFSADAFYICPTGLYKKEMGIATIADIEKYNPYQGKLYEIWKTALLKMKLFNKKSKRKIKKFFKNLFTKK
ncbi:MAG: hypothetical protein MJ120_05895 [Clostridia bacterium]|nr:hypothetical protein [Clostridia bacterium]